STQSACRATDTARVEVNPNPVASLTVPAHDSCADSKLILKGEGGGLYSWFYNNQVISGATSSSLAINQNGLYVLRVSTDKGCWDTASTNISLTFLTKPKADFIAPWGCKLKQISFVNTSDVAQSGSVRWKWEFGDGNTSDQKEPTYIYQDNNIYSVKLTVMPLSCPQNEDVVTKLVRISDGGGSGRRYPTVNTFKNTPTELSARPGATKYLWDPSVGLSNPRIQKPIFNDDQQNEYLIKIVTQEGCDLVDTLLVLLFEKEDVLVPDAFSPNGDGVNDYLDIFTVGIREIKFWVFNRWGQIMFETSDPAQRWDGTYMGKKQPLENYVWIAEAITNSGRKIRKRGQSILIR
ncbi:MAG: gliding motility-associated C-terminal domain-containing protein, partial [Bacteroidota bacterium]